MYMLHSPSDLETTWAKNGVETFTFQGEIKGEILHILNILHQNG